jgi:hypothetical protein
MSIPEVVVAHDDPVELLPNSIFTETLSVNS